MVDIKVKPRPIGATATVGRHGHPQVTSATGGGLAIVTGASEPGFNPLDLMFSSLAACLVLSARIAASRLQLLDRLVEVRVHVTGEKAKGEPTRIEQFTIDFAIDGDFGANEKMQIIHLAEEICTVSNTLKGSPSFEVRTS